MRNASLSGLKLTTLLCWVGYILYEAFYIPAYCKNCDIRIDLLVIAPILLILTLATIISFIKSRMKTHQ